MSKGLGLAHLVVVCLFVSSLLLTPITVDGTHMGDTLLLAHLGWRGVNGLVPVIDYPHFYGGMTAAFVTGSFKLFGVSFKSVDIAFVMMFAAAGAVLALLAWRRISGVAMTLILALASALVLGLSPIEVGRVLVPAHSFVYNHVGIVLMMGLVVFGLVPVENKGHEGVTALVGGVAGYALVLLKTTFGIVLPAVLIACALQGRWRSALLFLGGLVFGMVVLDPGMVRAVGSLEFLLGSAAADRAGGIGGRLGTALTMIWAQAPQIGVILVLAGMLIWAEGRGALRLLLAALVCALGYLAAVLTMGGSPTLKLIPFIIVLTVVVSQRAVVPPKRQVLRAALHAFPYGLTYALVLPALATSALAAVDAFAYARRPFVDDGPLAGYVVVGPATARAGLVGDTAADRRAEIIARTAERLESGGDGLDTSDAYVLLLEGVSLLREIPGVRSYGIAGNGAGFEFTVPMLSRVVPGYPVWPTGGLPGLETEGSLGADVDLVMILTDIPKAGVVNEELKALVARDFVRCRTSKFWTVYARKALGEKICEDGQSGGGF
ncbi:MAG: hypothetical protein KDK10_07530 [Maritimibacter sp.]|nr:hypothetical protein [Maritimibacter sp.]